MTTFEASFISWGIWGSIKNWLELKIEPPLADLAFLNPWNTLYSLFLSLSLTHIHIHTAYWKSLCHWKWHRRLCGFPNFNWKNLQRSPLLLFHSLKPLEFSLSLFLFLSLSFSQSLSPAFPIQKYPIYGHWGLGVVICLPRSQNRNERKTQFFFRSQNWNWMFVCNSYYVFLCAVDNASFSVIYQYIVFRFPFSTSCSIFEASCWISNSRPNRVLGHACIHSN